MTDIIRLSTGAAVRFDCIKPGVVRPTVMMVHGWGSPIFTSGSYERPRELLLRYGVNVLSISLRGHQEAKGGRESVTRQWHINDLRAAHQFLLKQSEVDPTQLRGLGVSYGAYLLAMLASEFEFERLALRAPALYPDKGWRKPVAELTGDPELRSQYRSHFHSADDNRALERLGNYLGDCLIVGSEFDEDMPPMLLLSYLSVLNRGNVRKIKMIRGAKHSLQGDQVDQYLDHLRTFLCA